MRGAAPWISGWLPRRHAMVAATAAILAVSIAGTGVEPAPGSTRYRIQELVERLDGLRIDGRQLDPGRERAESLLRVLIAADQHGLVQEGQRWST